MFVRTSILVAFLAVTVVPSSMSAQEVETASHTFENQVIPEPPTVAELELVSNLAEKYIAGTITEEELATLKEKQSNLATLDQYRTTYEAYAATAGDAVSGTDAADVPDTAPAAPVAAPVDALPIWFTIMTIINSVVVVGFLIVVLRRIKARRTIG
jgi:hypothetical protein